MSQDLLQPSSGWVNAGLRLQPPPLAERSLFFRSLSGISRRLGRPEMPDVITALHLNPRLFWPWLLFASRMMPFGKLPAAEREKVILRTGWNCRSRYEWGQHVDIALTVGVSAADILRISQGPAAFSDPHDRALMQACDDMQQHQHISDDSWATLARRYDKKLMIELMLLIGHYQMIAGFLNSAGLQLEAPIEARLRALEAALATNGLLPRA